jgi:Cu-processing system permease protein
MILTRSVLWLCMRYELLLAVRSRWLQLFAAVFAALSLVVANAGYVLSGGHGVQDFSRVAVSLVQMVLLLVPLAALVFGALSLTPDRGGAELMYAQPVSRSVILIGRMLGVWLALSAAELIGFGMAGLIVQWHAGFEGLSRYGALVLTAIGITGVFLAIAAMLASRNAGRRTRVLASALVVWFTAVVVYDVAAIAAASLLGSAAASRLLIVATLINPVDAARTGALLAIEGTGAFGAASLALLRVTNGVGGAAALILLSLAFWLFAPMGVAARTLSRTDI